MLTPAPDHGDLTLVVAWPHHPLSATSTVITAAELDRARSQILTLWPENGRPPARSAIAMWDDHQHREPADSVDPLERMIT